MPVEFTYEMPMDTVECPKCKSHNLEITGTETTKEPPCNITIYKCNDCGHEWKEMECEDKPKCPECGADLQPFNITKAADSGEAEGWDIMIIHWKCPNGHAQPDKCSEHFPECILETPSVDNPSDKCRCPCPHCGACAYRPTGIICRDKGNQCVQQVLCLECGEKYYCPPQAGEVCPFCCSAKNLVHVTMVDNDGKPLKDESGRYTTIIYCRHCKKGAEHEASATVPECE